MSIPLSNYRPFDIVKGVWDLSKRDCQEAKDWRQIARKATAAVLSFLALIPTFILDLLLSVRFLALHCFQKNSPTPPSATAPVRNRNLIRIPPEELIQRVLNSPPLTDQVTPENMNDYLKATVTEFVRLTFTLLPQEEARTQAASPAWAAKVGLVTGMIVHERACNANLIGRFRAFSGYISQQFASVLPIFRNELPASKDKATALLQVLTPSIRWELTDKGRELTAKFDEMAGENGSRAGFDPSFYADFNAIVANIQTP